MKRWYRKTILDDDEDNEETKGDTEFPDFDDIYKSGRSRNFGRRIAANIDLDDDDDDKPSSEDIDKKILLVKSGKYKPKKDDHWTIHYIYNLNK